MSTGVEKERIRRLYQALLPPAIAVWLRTAGSRLGETSPVMLAYATSLVLALFAMAGSLAATTTISGSGWVVLLLAIVAAIAERGSVQMSSTMDLEESISLLPTLFAAVLLGPLAGLIVASASMLGDFRKPYLRRLCTPRRAASTAASQA